MHNRQRILILYGSQTGISQDLAETIWRSSRHLGFTGPVLAMDSYPIQKLITEELVVFVCSTTGQGDQPDNMLKFWKFLLKKSLPTNSLSGLRFAVLGLGDSSYAKYNFVAKKLFKRLIQLSAQSLIPIGLCDDQHDYGVYGTYHSWIKDLWTSLDAADDQQANNILNNNYYTFKIKVDEIMTENKKQQYPSEEKLKWPFPDKCEKLILIENKRVTTLEHFQDVRHLKFQFPDSLKWQPFDVLNVQPANCDQNVNKLFEVLNMNKETLLKFSAIDEEMPLPICFENQCLTLESVAKYIWDFLAIPRQRVFELLALNCNDETEKEKLLEFCSPEGCEDLIKYANTPRRSILEVLYDFPNATTKLTIPILFELFNSIQQRSFSIASVPETGTLDLLVAVVEYKTLLSEPRKGLCSNWLKNLHPNNYIYGAVRKGTMHLNSEQEIKPLIMIGPGTGIAPFRSYLLRKEYELGLNQIILVFFGCRSQYKDFYFKEDFKRMQSKNVARFFYAFSRDQEHKCYVQHVIKQQDNLIRDLLLIKQGSVLTAGNSKNMPQQVKDAFSEIFGNRNYLDEIMIKNERYQEEVWS